MKNEKAGAAVWTGKGKLELMELPIPVAAEDGAENYLKGLLKF